MTPFLQQVAGHYFDAGNIERRCFIFPNRRSMAFFRKYLGERIARDGTKPVAAPSMMTMNDFFYRIDNASVTDRIPLLLELYRCYKDLNPKAEGLDDFIFWGDVLLSDFDDVDKYLVNPKHLFANIADLKGIEDSYSYLSQTQMDAIERFLNHFKNKSGLKVDLRSEDGKDYKVRFLQIWDILFALYTNFNESLRKKGMSYEGQVYRDIAERLEKESVKDILAESFNNTDNFVFVGLNALNECEKKLLTKLRNAGMAEYCWDFSSPMIKDSHNKSSFFLSENVTAFPQAFKIDPDGTEAPEFNVLSVPGSIGMAKQIPSILERLEQVQGKTPDLETAIVLPDEGLLIPALNCIPPHIGKLNVTMGYPLGGSELWSLIGDITSMQAHLRFKDGEWWFYHKQVWSIFSNSVFRNALGEEGRKIVESVKEGTRYYIPMRELSGDPVMDLIFRAAATELGSADTAQIRRIEEYLQRILAGVAARIKQIDGMGMELDFARDLYLAVGRLAECELPVLPATFFRLLNQLVSGISVPFHGEPLSGLQLMGPLETRALDFDNVIILSCNEGMFPRRSVSSSFIPAELRKGFSLPTYEYQDSVWAYYFYRLVQRAKNVWLVFNSQTEGLRGGEESRYIKQLEMHFGVKLNRYVSSATILRKTEDASVPKEAKHIEALKESHLSASSLKSFLNCPAQFYYGSVLRLKKDSEVSESMDYGMIGNAFHKTMENLYGETRVVDGQWLENIIKDDEKIRKTVAKNIMEELKSFEISGKNIIYLDIICRYVKQVFKRDLELLGKRGVKSFKIIELEKKFITEIGGFNFIGYADRIDSFADGEVRVVDYKTGKVTDNDFLINEDNAETVAGLVFGEDNGKRPNIALQLYLYDRMAGIKYPDSKILNSIYQTSKLFVSGVEEVELNDKFNSLMDKGLEDTLKRIEDLGEPWTRKGMTKDGGSACDWCDFKTICGK